jgi:hypothetical protein
MELAIYIAGKITGEDEEACKRKFEAVEKKLNQIGVRTVINPWKLGIPPRWKYRDTIDKCLEVMRERANSILLLNDWSDSSGAIEEYELAMELGYEIFHEDGTDEIVRFIKMYRHKWIDTSEIEFP